MAWWSSIVNVGLKYAGTAIGAAAGSIIGQPVLGAAVGNLAQKGLEFGVKKLDQMPAAKRRAAARRAALAGPPVSSIPVKVNMKAPAFRLPNGGDTGKGFAAAAQLASQVRSRDPVRRAKAVQVLNKTAFLARSGDPNAQAGVKLVKQAQSAAKFGTAGVLVDRRGMTKVGSFLKVD